MEEKQQKDQEELAELETKLEAAKLEAAKLEAAKQKAIEQQNKNKQMPTKLTPIVSPAALSNQRFGPKTFTPVSNILAILRAKEKVDQLRAAKQQQQPQYAKTLAQTAAKGAPRIAHTSATPVVQVQINPEFEQSYSQSWKRASSAVKLTKFNISNLAQAQQYCRRRRNNAIYANLSPDFYFFQSSPSKPAPPVLEASSTKISYNIRTQYYNMMVKHCLTIYDECTDAWERVI